jgi:hypothetical protein
MDVDNTTQDYTARENLWDQQWPTTGNEGGDHLALEPDSIDEMAAFPDVAGTSDPLESVRDAEPYMPPVDPPVLPGGREAIHTSTGFGTDVEEEMYHEPFPRGDEDIREEGLLTLHQDSLTSKYPLDIDVDQGVVYLRGQVPSFEDAEHASNLLGNLPGVVDVIDETELNPTGVE